MRFYRSYIDVLCFLQQCKPKQDMTSVRICQLLLLMCCYWIMIAFLFVSDVQKVNPVRSTPQMSSAASLRLSWSQSVLSITAWTRWTPCPTLYLNPRSHSIFPSRPWSSSDWRTEVCSWTPLQTLKCWGSRPHRRAVDRLWSWPHRFSQRTARIRVHPVTASQLCQMDWWMRKSPEIGCRAA